MKRWNAENEVIQAEIKRLRDALDDAGGEEREKLADQLKAAQKRQPTPLPTISSVANDRAKRTQIHVLDAVKAISQGSRRPASAWRAADVERCRVSG